MEMLRCVPQKAAKLFLAGLFIIFAAGFIITGFTVLPIIGFVVAIPFIGISVYLIKVHLNQQCAIES